MVKYDCSQVDSGMKGRTCERIIQETGVMNDKHTPAAFAHAEGFVVAEVK